MGLDMGDPAAVARGFPAAAGDFRVRVVEDFDRLVFGLVMLAQDGGSLSGPSSSGARPHLRVVE